MSKDQVITRTMLLYAAGFMKVKDIAKGANVSPAAIRYWAKKHGLPSRRQKV